MSSKHPTHIIVAYSGQGYPVRFHKTDEHSRYFAICLITNGKHAFPFVEIHPLSYVVDGIHEGDMRPDLNLKAIDSNDGILQMR